MRRGRHGSQRGRIAGALLRYLALALLTWVLLTATPVLVLRFEADNAEALARIQRDFKRILSAARPEAQLPY